MNSPDAALRDLVSAIVARDAALVREQLVRTPILARAQFAVGASRHQEQGFFIGAIGRWIIAGDSALHLAAAAYNFEAAKMLIAAGADVNARNRHGHTPLQSAAVGNPNSPAWNPQAQAEMIAALVTAGADPNGTDKRGVTPLHVAVRTRSATAVRALLAAGADPAQPNGNGSTPMLLALQNTGRGGSGSPEAKAEQREIIRLLEDALAQARER
jgi:hypothetical protein